MDSLRVFSPSAASGLACVRLVSVLALQSALLTLCAQSPVIYNFTGTTSDGANPHCAPLINSSGRLFGTTVNGGSSGDGVFYKLAPGTPWTETILHNFAGATTDGSSPDGDLLLASGNIYGTTASGGTNSVGTVYEMKNSSGTWSESVLYNFAGGTGDGRSPYAGLILSSGVLYGTTFYGGTYGDGTVYSLTPPTPWAESVLYSFGATSDGANPHSVLLDAGSGVYYGTTYNGGAGYGTVYELQSGSPWSETPIYTFTGGSDGSNPHSAVVMDSSGALYGTTVYGGAHSKGTVYKLAPGGGGWTESVLHSFAGASDGAIPVAGVVFGSTQSVLYGATTNGGGSGNCTGGCGTVYSLTLTLGVWGEAVLYPFTGYANNDGEDPYSDITYSGGWIYGTTYTGGTSTNCGSSGCGTVYALQP